jgi:AcrR family transcriptional regulator
MSALDGLPPTETPPPQPAEVPCFPLPGLVADVGGDSPIARKRRDEIVTAAADIIARKGLHDLSLKGIETQCHMSRGQLTYYFKSKEDILLAVFDRMLAGMVREIFANAERDGVARPGEGSVLDRIRHGLDNMMSGHSPERAELHSLTHTFLAQVHNPEYRRKLAAANAGWRQHIAADITASAGGTPPPVPPAVTASIAMALFQGLGGQLAVDPEAFDRAAVADACLRILAPLLGPPPDARGDT